MEQQMIEAQHLTKRYGKTIAVDDVSFVVQPGRVTGFVGPNGAGKSTTMRMILGLDTPSSGSVHVNGRPCHEMTDPLRSVGALLDAKAIVGDRSAANHLKWLADTNGIKRRRVPEVLDRVGLSDVAGKRLGTFSLGMNQRLGIAAALLGDPDPDTVAVGLIAVIGVGLGGVIRHTAGATTALSLVVVSGLLFDRFVLAGLCQYLPATVLQAAVTVHRSAGLLRPGPAIVILGVYSALALGAASIRVAHRDA